MHQLTARLHPWQVKAVLREGALVTYLAIFWVFAVGAGVIAVRRMPLTNPLMQVSTAAPSAATVPVLSICIAGQTAATPKKAFSQESKLWQDCDQG